MIAGYLLGLREGLEAALILGITFGVLRRTRRQELAPAAWAGTGVAVAVSVVAAAILMTVGMEVEGRTEQLFEGATMLLAAGVLTWMIFWMSRQGAEAQRGIEHDVEQAALRRHATAVFSVAFLAVLREGIETALFLSAAAFQDKQSTVVAGGMAGIATAGLLGWGLYRATVGLNVKRFFQVTGALLLLFAAGLAAHGVHEFVEAGLLPALIDPIWNTGAVLPESSVVGAILRTLFGYTSDPTLLEALAYAAYLAVVGWQLRRRRPARPSPAPAAG